MFRSALIFGVWRRWQKRIPRGGSENSREITASGLAGNIFSRFFDQPPLWCGDSWLCVLFVLRMIRLQSPLFPGQLLPSRVLTNVVRKTKMPQARAADFSKIGEQLMKILCPNCETEVAVEEVDLSTGWARCRECNELFQVPEIARSRTGNAFDAPTAPVFDGPIERPADARILIQRRPDKLFVYVPPFGFRLAVLPVMGFAVFWLGFVAFWTAGALGMFGGRMGLENILFACFSIPFWLVGFAMLGGCLWAMGASRLVYMDASILMTRLKVYLFSWRWSISRDLLQTVRLGTTPASRTENSGSLNRVLAPHVVEIVYKNGKLPIACASADEQRWVYGEIRAFLDSVPYRPGAEPPIWQEEAEQFRPLSRDVDFDRDRFTS